MPTPQDMLQSGISWLAGQLKQNAAEPVTYARGALSVVVRATIGKVLLKLQDETGGSRVEWTDKDFLIDAADLVLPGLGQVEPLRGDQVTVTTQGGTQLYEVLPYEGEPPWRWSDPYRTIYRVHTKMVG